MADPRELDGEEAEFWYQELESTDGFDHAFEAADITIERDDLDGLWVKEYPDGKIQVRLKHSESEGNYTSATGVFDSNEELVYAEIDDGVVAAPLAGHGDVWRYEEGEVTESTWIA